ncbi:adenylate/guanylate cyclase domain-containing protein [Alphaproteobacteria bacterium LMO-S08]|nr:adenylate/guanylate cyclase domain-containing protein [Alphaproteobacteria bacterium LMO-S08]
MKPREIPPPERKPVTIIDLDEKSLGEVGQWPWPRNILAQLVENLMKMGAVVVAFDIVFAEPDRMNPSAIADALKGLDEDTKNKIRQFKSNDEIFAETIKRSRVVLGQSTVENELEGVRLPPVKKSIAIRKYGPNVPDPLDLLPSFPALVRNVPIIEQAAAGRFGGHGIFSIIPEQDGIIRRIPSLFVQGKDMFPALSVEMLRLATGRPTILVKVDQAGIKSLGIAKGLEIPTDQNGRMWPYFSKSDKAKYVSAVDVLNGTADPAMIKGKLTILGTSAIGLKDIRSIPTESNIPGVEVHVQIIETVLNKAYLTRPNFARGVELSVILFGGLAMIVLVPWVGALWTFMVFGVTTAGVGFGSWHAFAEYRMLIDAVFTLVAIFLLYSTLTYLNYVREEASKKQVRGAFAHYLSPDMVERLAENPDSLKLGGEMRDMTLLFCDVRGFTTISEQFDPVGLTSLINKLLTPLTNAILKRKGTIDKYMGDCIMAFWNAPLDNPNHAMDGCRSALAMLAEMEPLNTKLEQEAKEEGRKHVPLKVGLGLNSGPAVVGNMGSDMRFDYSVLGDTVNLAARLEGQSKSYGMNVVLGPNTYEAVKDELACIDLDFIQVKGKLTGVMIYGLLGDETVAQKPEFQELRKLIFDAQEAYRAQKWDEAEAMFKTIRERGNDANKCWDLEANLDVLCDVYEERIAEYRVNPPPADWDGVFVATSK